MTTALFTLAFLAPAIANAAAQLPLSLFKRQTSGNDFTCGFPSGSPDDPITCANPTKTCATNTFFGIHGCCDPVSNTPCTLSTSCIASTAMTASCTDTACSSDEAIVKCTLSTAQKCYQWHFIYDRMVAPKQLLPALRIVPLV